MYASSKTQEEYPWWAGNARFIHLSNTFIVAHVAQAALIMAWAGVFTLFELAVYDPSRPMYTQGLIVLPHLVTEGWGVGPGGTLDHPFTCFAIGVIHIVAAAVLAAGAYFHRTRLPARLDDASGPAANFHFEWDAAPKLGQILGVHLVVLGLGAGLLAAKAMVFGGLYDTHLEQVRLVSSPTLDPGSIWDYRTHLFDVDNLEDLVGGHIYVAGLLIAGGAWHILVPPFQWVRRVFLFSADGILAYSLFGIALAGFAASYYCGFNRLAYPVEFYGPTLELKSAFLPYYFDPNASMVDGYTSRTWLANAHFYLAFFFLQGGLWHYQRAMGFDIRQLTENWRQNLIEARNVAPLVYQQPLLNQPQTQALWAFQYEAPEAEPQPTLKREQPFEDYVYQPSQGMQLPSLTTNNGVEKTLYQTIYQGDRDSFYQTPCRSDARTRFGYGAGASPGFYEQPRLLAEVLDYPQPLEDLVYEPRQTNGHDPVEQAATVKA